MTVYVCACAAVVGLVLIMPFFIEPGDRAMREKERRDSRDAFDSLFDGETEREKNTEADDRLGACHLTHERPAEWSHACR